MTIKVTIEHSDPASKFSIAVHQCQMDVDTGDYKFSLAPARELKPGEKAEFYVWSTNDLLIKEIL
jgi:hypothetical protein